MSIMSGITTDRSWLTCVSLLCSHIDFKKISPMPVTSTTILRVFHLEIMWTSSYWKIYYIFFPMALILHQSNVRNKSYGLGKLVSSKHFEFSHYLYSSWCMCFEKFLSLKLSDPTSLESLGHQFYFALWFERNKLRFAFFWGFICMQYFMCNFFFLGI